MSRKPRLKTTKEIARYLRVSRDTLYVLIKKNKIPFLRVGGQYRFNQKDIDNWLKDDKVTLSSAKQKLEIDPNQLCFPETKQKKS